MCREPENPDDIIQQEENERNDLEYIEDEDESRNYCSDRYAPIGEGNEGSCNDATYKKYQGQPVEDENWIFQDGLKVRDLSPDGTPEVSIDNQKDNENRQETGIDREGNAESEENAGGNQDNQAG